MISAVRCGVKLLVRLTKRAYLGSDVFRGAPRTGEAAIFGTPALDAYFADPTGGVLMRSPKSFLGSDIKAENLSLFEKGSRSHVRPHQKFGSRAE
jgi:hypothetical protein